MLIVDTTRYSGNFESELFAYATGQQGEYGRANDLATSSAGDVRYLLWWSANVVQQPDEYGNLFPVVIHPTPGWFNNGMGENYLDVPENYDIAVANAVASMRKSQEKLTAMIQDRLDREDFEDHPDGWSREACLRQLQANAVDIRRVETARRRHDAFQSVAIFVKEFPPTEVLEEFMARVRHFGRNHATLCRFTGQGEIGILDFRLVATSRPYATNSPA
jgi:hypothetical protein